jgi:hypothetical protein
LKILGKKLSQSDGFASLLLINLLRKPLEWFPDMIAVFVRANVSLGRIKSFLKSRVIRGIKTSSWPFKNMESFSNDVRVDEHTDDNNIIPNLSPDVYQKAVRGGDCNLNESAITIDGAELAWPKIERKPDDIRTSRLIGLCSFASRCEFLRSGVNCDSYYF